MLLTLQGLKSVSVLIFKSIFDCFGYKSLFLVLSQNYQKVEWRNWDWELSSDSKKTKNARKTEKVEKVVKLQCHNSYAAQNLHNSRKFFVKDMAKLIYLTITIDGSTKKSMTSTPSIKDGFSLAGFSVLLSSMLLSALLRPFCPPDHSLESWPPCRV